MKWLRSHMYIRGLCAGILLAISTAATLASIIAPASYETQFREDARYSPIDAVPARNR